MYSISSSSSSTEELYVNNPNILPIKRPSENPEESTTPPLKKRKIEQKNGSNNQAKVLLLALSSGQNTERLGAEAIVEKINKSMAEGQVYMEYISQLLSFENLENMLPAILNSPYAEAILWRLLQRLKLNERYNDYLCIIKELMNLPHWSENFLHELMLSREIPELNDATLTLRCDSKENTNVQHTVVMTCNSTILSGLGYFTSLFESQGSEGKEASFTLFLSLEKEQLQMLARDFIFTCYAIISSIKQNKGKLPSFPIEHFLPIADMYQQMGELEKNSFLFSHLCCDIRQLTKENYYTFFDYCLLIQSNSMKEQIVHWVIASTLSGKLTQEDCLQFFEKYGSNIFEISFVREYGTGQIHDTLLIALLQNCVNLHALTFSSCPSPPM